MCSIIITAITALFSGFLGSMITIIYEKLSEKKKQKVKVFTALMALRYEIISEESVRELNMIDAVFYDCETVRKAYKAFIVAANEPDSPKRNQNINDAYLRLLEEIATNIKYKKINWQDIKTYYYPEGLAQKKQQENQMRSSMQFITKVMENNAQNAQQSNPQPNQDDKNT